MDGGKFSDTPITNQETWFVPGGGAVAALYEFKQPGLYVYLSHNLIEAVLLGAAAHMNVEGKWNDDLMIQLKNRTRIQPRQWITKRITSNSSDQAAST